MLLLTWSPVALRGLLVVWPLSAPPAWRPALAHLARSALGPAALLAQGVSLLLCAGLLLALLGGFGVRLVLSRHSRAALLGTGALLLVSPVVVFWLVGSGLPR